MPAESDQHSSGATSGIDAVGYRTERYIASGGMGDLYEATQLALDRRVALKVISSRLGTDGLFQERFRREIKLAASLDHPNILPVYQTGELADGRLFLAMRLVDGPDLKGLIKERGPLGPSHSIEILIQVGEALDAAHRSGLIHGDVKPANVLLEWRNGGWHPYLTDFGLARSREMQAPDPSARAISGTIDYIAPELITGGPTDHRVDVYAFGCMVYECLTGRPPYRRSTTGATLIAHANAPVPLPSAIRPTLPRSLDVAVARAMEKDWHHRAWSCGTLMRWTENQIAAQMHPDGNLHSGVDESLARAICTKCGHVNRFAGGFCRQCGESMVHG